MIISCYITALLIIIILICSCEKNEVPSAEEQESPYGQFTDNRDGKTYKTVNIGTQIWMAENLNYETSDGSWFYDSIPYNASTYGRLYNWETANNACPSGWHLPSDDEWKQLEMTIGMSQSDADDINWRGTDEGTKLKAVSGWSRNGNGTDEYGFTALPGGYLSSSNDFRFKNNVASFWSSTTSIKYAIFRELSSAEKVS